MGLTNLQKEYLAYQGELDNVARAEQRFADLPSLIAEQAQCAKEAEDNLNRIQATLAKPWDTYAGKGSRRNRDPEPQHPVARECYRYFKQIAYAKEAVQCYREELRDKDKTLADLRKKAERVSIAFECVASQLTAINAIPNEQHGAGAWGARCLEELYGIEEAQAKILDYYTFVGKELEGGYVNSGS